MEQRAYIGTYTGSGSKGIYRIGFNEGQICLRGEWPAVNPSYLVGGDGMLYAVRETAGGGAVSYRMEGDGGLVPSGDWQVYADAPCHLCLDGRFLYVSNYASGSLSEFLLGEGMEIAGPPRVIADGQAGAQAKSHVHFACVTPGGEYLAVCDLGLDEVLFYPRTEAGIHESAERVSVPAGAGPRHAAFGREGIWYVLCELSCQLLVYRGYGDKAELVQRFSTLRTQDAQGSCAALRLSPDGKLLLATVRGADTLALWDILEDGRAGAPRFYDSQGSWPRDAAFTPCGKYVICACERDDRLTAFSLEGGTLRYLGFFELPSPTCICFG